MPSCLIYFGTSEGQTSKIAEQLAGHLAERGITVEVVKSPEAVELSRFDAIMLGDSVHVGHYHRHVLEFVRTHRERLQSMRSAFFSVCLGIGSKNEEDRERARGVVEDMIEQSGWHPDHVAIFAGALAYSKYGFLTRFIMKRIAGSEGLSTDSSRDYEYTDWASVADFANRFADEVVGEQSHPTPAAPQQQ